MVPANDHISKCGSCDTRYSNSWNETSPSEEVNAWARLREADVKHCRNLDLRRVVRRLKSGACEEESRSWQCSHIGLLKFILYNHSVYSESRSLQSHSWKAPTPLIELSDSRNEKMTPISISSPELYDNELDIWLAVTPVNVIEEKMKSSLSSSDLCTSANEDEGWACRFQHKVTGSNVNSMSMNTRPSNDFWKQHVICST